MSLLHFWALMYLVSLFRVRKLSDFIKNILTEGLTGLERQEGK